ncbi:replication initiator [Streptosporangium jomthongense]|uniref:Replication initiator n=1 Tax=Streptosporangium jomthongense TaxID=1193683 RepID=A0ABV8F9P9_9ACTN
MVERVSDPAGYRRWAGQVERTGHCIRPVRLVGSAMAADRTSGEVRASTGDGDGVLLVACGDRRETVCPPCAATYKRDAWHVFAAGLTGREDAGQGPRAAASASVPETVARHPAVFATLTAPSFGAVHSYRDGGVCHPVRQGGKVRRCPHGVVRSCGMRHGPRDRTLGAPLCLACTDLVSMVLWNAFVGELWRRTTIYVYRALARLASVRTGQAVTVRSVRRVLRVSYAKVAEGQRRGVVHLHVIARLDGVCPDDPDALLPPPAWADAALLGEAIREAAGVVGVPLPSPDGRMRVAEWGTQFDVRAISAGDDRRKLAGYLAKYSTKTVGAVLDDAVPRDALWDREQAGSAGGRRRHRVPPPAHLGALAATAARLAGHPACAGLRLARHASAFGYRGHVTSKSRKYSTTFAALRAVRRAWRIAHRAGTPSEGDPWAFTDDPGTVVVSSWRMVGVGHTSLGDLALAESLAREHRQARQAARVGLLE